MIEVRDKQILIDGSPRLLISGEIHYFRLPREAWDDRIRKLKAAGGNTVATYIPWLCHELANGEIDLDGHTRPELDLGAFIDLVHEHGMWFIARPGPFIMAEMKNEGIPYRLYTDHPELIPVGWDGAAPTTRTLDYLGPAFLAAARGWYAAVIPVIAARQIDRDGPVIGIQLDNEVGMLSWVSNTPDLTDALVADFQRWLVERDPGVRDRYPFGDGDPASFAAATRSPHESIAGEVMQRLGQYMRDRYARYIAELRQYAEEFGISGIPFIVNIHGTDADGGASYPIGISQLYESYTKDAGYLAGSDYYLGELTGVNAGDLYLMNAFMAAVNRPEQPLTSMEFEAGEGDYGQSLGARLDPSASDFKLRMSVVQGNRLINYYLFTGGYNARLDPPSGDGNDRISFTGERHGTNAPIGPEGQENFTLPRLARTSHLLATWANELAVADEEYDQVAVGFIPDYWMTESVHPRSAVMGGIVADLKRYRFGGPAKATLRAMLHGTWRYTALDIQHRALDPATTPVLVLASASFMAADVQRKLVDYLHAGGRLFLHGAIPLRDMTGAPCRILHDALGLHWLGMRWSDHRTFLSGTLSGWAAPRPEWRLGCAQVFRPDRDDVILRVYGRDEACGFDLAVGAGRAIVITAEIPVDLTFYADLFAKMGVAPGLRHDHPLAGIFLSSATTPDGARFVHALNLDGADKVVRITLDGVELFDGRAVTLRRRDGVMVPIGVDLGDVRIEWSTAEIQERLSDGVVLRLTGPDDAIALTTSRDIVPSDDYLIEAVDDGVVVSSRVVGHGDEYLTVRWR